MSDNPANTAANRAVSNENNSINQLEQMVTRWEKAKGRQMKSYLPTRELLFLLSIIQRFEGISDSEKSEIKRIHEQVSEAVSMLISKNP